MNESKINKIKSHAETKGKFSVLSCKSLIKKLPKDEVDILIGMTYEKAKEKIKQQNYIEAEKIIEQALKVKKDLKLSQYLVIVKMYLKKNEEARKICLENIKKYRLAEDYNNLSLLERSVNNVKEAYKYGKKAYLKKPESPAIIANYAITAIANKDHELAMKLINEAIAVDKKNPMLYANKASMLCEDNKLLQAEKYYKKAIKLNPIEAQLYIDYFYCLVSQKKYKEAWYLYESRYQRIRELKENIKSLGKPIMFFKKNYYPEKICIIPEQGLGDVLMSLRFVEEFQKLAPNSYFYSSETIYPFAKELPIRISDKFDESSSHVLSIMSLPFHLGIETIPPPVSPIKHNPIKTDELKIGLCWAGSPFHPMDSSRSTYLKWYDKFLNDKKMKIFSFMKDRRVRMYANSSNKIDYAEGFDDYKIVDYSNDMTDALQTAKLFNNIDILITVDTFTAHIAGSCGVPTYMLINEKPDWRWGVKGEYSDWYPSVKIIRKPRNESFQNVINSLYKRIKDEL